MDKLLRRLPRLDFRAFRRKFWRPDCRLVRSTFNPSRLIRNGSAWKGLDRSISLNWLRRSEHPDPANAMSHPLHSFYGHPCSRGRAAVKPRQLGGSQLAQTRQFGKRQFAVELHRFDCRPAVRFQQPRNLFGPRLNARLEHVWHLSCHRNLRRVRPSYCGTLRAARSSGRSKLFCISASETFAFRCAVIFGAFKSRKPALTSTG